MISFLEIKDFQKRYFLKKDKKGKTLSHRRYWKQIIVIQLSRQYVIYGVKLVTNQTSWFSNISDGSQDLRKVL